jgi:hypothetical protein
VIPTIKLPFRCLAKAAQGHGQAKDSGQTDLHSRAVRKAHRVNPPPAARYLDRKSWTRPAQVLNAKKHAHIDAREDYRARRVVETRPFRNVQVLSAN